MKDLVPKHKDDLSSVERLESYEFSELKPIVPELLEWLQDMNWPIAFYMANLLRPHINEMADELITILNKKDDPMWKYWVLTLMSGYKSKIDLQLMQEIKRIKDQPDFLEIECEVDEIAGDILAYQNFI